MKNEGVKNYVFWLFWGCQNKELKQGKKAFFG
jgi:hypothetical protein